MLSKLLGWSVVVIGLLLVGVQKGSADQIYACKDNTSGILYMYATPPSAGCGPGRTLLTLAFGPGSALGASQFSCAGPADNVPNGAPLSDPKGYTAGVTLGSSGVTYTPPGSTFLLQPGGYQVQLIVPVVTMDLDAGGQISLSVNVLVNGNVVDHAFGGGTFSNRQATFDVIGDSLLQISAANTVVGFNVAFSTNGGTPQVFLNGCRIVFTRLQ
jgi:hypothetical protein